jgi:acyl-coenzyme A synthetase/AMP-(fatty) acid ligase
VPLTPAQARFFALRQPAPAHWNQALMLDVPGELADDTVRDAAAAARIRGALDAMRLCVVDADGHETPPGVAGELTIAGAGLAQGYTRAPGRTARSFRPDPLSPEPGARLYAMGDLAVRGEDGTLLLGRADDHVKINGYRIELGDVEAHLRALDNVADAAATVRRGLDGRVRGLEAHLVLRDPARPFDDAPLRDVLVRQLPAYMVQQASVLAQYTRYRWPTRSALLMPAP